MRWHTKAEEYVELIRQDDRTTHEADRLKFVVETVRRFVFEVVLHRATIEGIGDQQSSPY